VRRGGLVRRTEGTMPRVLVLGGTGLLGHMVAKVLRDEGLRVDATRRVSPKDPWWLNAEDGAAGLRAFFAQAGPYQYLINCIGVTKASVSEDDPASVRRAVAVNALFPHDLATVAQQTGARVIHISTDGVFQGTADGYAEGAPKDCTDMYGKTKSLGEVPVPGFLTIRCSIVGPDPARRRGLLEWFRAQPPGAVLTGYTDHYWNGVTTVQFARLCHALIMQDRFAEVCAESQVHHFCPNQAVSKCELLELFRSAFGAPVTIVPASSGRPVRRILRTGYRSLGKLAGENLNMFDAVRELAGFGRATTRAI
jgi:dTDP-4-dehydrorhamnose reductase